MMNTSVTKRGTLDFSSDLERGAAPRSIADEKSDVPLLAVEIHRCELKTFSLTGMLIGNFPLWTQRTVDF